MTDYKKLSCAILESIKKHPMEPGAYEDLLFCLREWSTQDKSNSAEHGAHAMNREELLKRIQRVMPLVTASQAEKMYQHYKHALCWEATVDFDSYLRYVELESSPDKQFYKPRRGYLKPIVEGYQEILDGKIHLLTISLPKRAGKSSIGINFTAMLSGREPNRSTLMEGTGDDLVHSFYSGLLEYVQEPSEYLFYDVFPESKLVATGAKDYTINMRNKTRFPTIMCRSIDSRQVGLSEATNLLYLDDCVEGRVEAKNRERLDQKWEVIAGDILGRALEGTPIVATGTRYSIYDPIGRLQEKAREQGWNWKAIEIPALDPETDESNYEYYNPKIGRKQFTTAFFREQRDLLSQEQWESEFQQQPFEAKGLLFNKDELNYFFELPVDVAPDSIVAIGDTAESGSDSTCMGVFCLYGHEAYLVDVVFDNSPPEVTKPECAKVIMDTKAGSGLFESNNAGQYYARDVDELLRSKGYRFSMRTKRTISNKKTRIELASDGIKKSFWFRHPGTYDRNSQYAQFMRELTTYTRTGKVPHDDAPDMCSMAENEFRMLLATPAEVIDRPF